MTARSLRAPLGSNPYVVGPAVYGNGPFFGRQSLIDEISTAAKAGGQLLALHGAGRIGKTSLLRHIESQAISGAFPVYLEPDLYGDMGATAALDKLAQELISIVNPGCEFDSALDDPNDWGSALYKALLPKLKKKRLFLLVDDVQHGQKSDVMYGLLALAGAGARAGGVFTVSDLNKRKLPPALIESKVLEIGILSTANAKLLIESPVKRSIDFEEEAVLHLIDLSGRHPAILQSLCYETFDRVRARPVDSISMMEVVGAAQRIEASEASFTWLWQGLKDEQKLLLAAMSEAAPIDRAIFRAELDEVLLNNHVELKQRAVSTALRQLSDMGLLRKEGRSKLSFAVEVFRPWILRFHPLDTMGLGQNRQDLARKSSARHLEAAQEAHRLGRLNHALEEYRRARDADPEFIEVSIGYGLALSECGKHPDAVDVLSSVLDKLPEQATEALVQAYVSWISDVREAGKRYESLLGELVELAPEHKDVVAIRRQFLIDEARVELAGTRTQEAMKALAGLFDSGGVDGVVQLENMAMEHLVRVLQRSQGRRGRLIPDFVDLLKLCYPGNSTPSFRYIGFLLSEAERAEAQSPPASLSYYRRAEERLTSMPDEAMEYEPLRRRLEAGRRRVDGMFLREQEAALTQMLEERQYKSARSLATELVERHQSGPAVEALKQLDKIRQFGADYQRILDLMAADRSAEARVVAQALLLAAPDFVGSDGRTAKALLGQIGVEEVAEPEISPVASAPSSWAEPAPAAEAPSEGPAGVLRSQDLPIPPPVARQNTAPLWGAIVILALLFVGYVFMDGRNKVEPSPLSSVSERSPNSMAAASRVERDVLVSGEAKVVPSMDKKDVIPPVVPAVEAEVVPKKVVVPVVSKGKSTAPTKVASVPKKVSPKVDKAAPQAKAQVTPPSSRLTAAQLSAAEKLVFEGRRQVQRGAYRSAADSYESSLDINEAQPSVWQDLGLVYYALKQYGDAERTLKKALTMNPAALIRFDLAKVYRAQNREEDAKAEFGRAVEDPSLPSSMAREAREYLEGLDAPKQASSGSTAPAAAAPPSKAVKSASLWGSGSGQGEAIQLFGSEKKEEVEDSP